jgi:NAD(P)-dependent dehydrogenase (short-subunit alcohol dehydrogenase family)
VVQRHGRLDVLVTVGHLAALADGAPPAPLGRRLQPDEAARSVLYLSSPMSSFTTASPSSSTAD